MSSASDEPSSGPRRTAAKPKKKAPSHFKPGGTSLVAGLLAGADQVAERSFLGGAHGESEPGSRAAPATTTHSGGAATTSDKPTASAPPQVEATAAAVLAERGDKDAVTQTGSGNEVVVSAGEWEPLDRVNPGMRESSSHASSATRFDAPVVAGQRPATEAEPNDRSTRDPKASAATGRPHAAGSWAHAAIHASFADAKIRSETWTSYGFRLDPEVLADLKERLKADRRTSGNTMLGQGHYLDAALRRIPEDVASQIAMAQAFLDDRMGVVGAGKQSTFRVGPFAYALVSTLNQGLQEADYGRRGLYVVSAALEDLLQALAAEGELQRPERRTKAQRPASL
ncbi:hypothetical protein [Streptomyces sp. NPDC057910]|uniref:hypothetical protein n=1 Tax=Streptomyces sp. NPDC057910 TaxID=3346278 RepID=UPI0036EDAD59